jgi:MarR family transcriptional regulator, organic hydroperoxide resistance regulator
VESESPLLRELKQTKPFPDKTEEATVALLRTSDLVRRNVAAVLEPHGITVQQYNVLRILRGAGERGLPTLEIAERMVEQTPGITRLIDRLELKRLVTRERCLTDRRQVFCRIAGEGLALLAALDKPMLDAEMGALGSLDQVELVQLIELLDRARKGLNAALSVRRRKSGN